MRPKQEEEETRRRQFLEFTKETKGGKALTTLEAFSEVLSCGELKELRTFYFHFSSYLARDLLPAVPRMAYVPSLTVSHVDWPVCGTRCRD